MRADKEEMERPEAVQALGAGRDPWLCFSAVSSSPAGVNHLQGVQWILLSLPLSSHIELGENEYSLGGEDSAIREALR